MLYPIRVTINDEVVERSVPASELLADFLRNDLLLTGTKVACGTGDCGACTVLLDGKIIPSCLVLAVEVDGHCLQTVEGFVKDGRPSPVQEALACVGGVQCGFCTPGIVVAAHALLREHPRPTEAQIRAGLAGNLCRCTGYVKIIQAIQVAAGIEQ